jgi:thiol-disulfide isomerase/thioredoxin
VLTLLAPALSSVLLAVQLLGQPVELRPGVADSKLAPRFSPKGTQIALAPKAMPGLPGIDHLEGRLKLGPPRVPADPGQLFALARSAEGKPYDTLIHDADRDGSLADEARISVDPSTVRGKVWSTFAAAPRVNHATKGAPAVWEEYPVSLWVVVEKPEEVPAVVRYSRRGFLTGTVTVGGKAHVILLADGNNDGVFGAGDSWTVRADDTPGAFTAGESRAVGDFVWAGGTAWKLVLEGTAGRKGRLVPFDPGTTQAEDSARRDRLREDREAPRAEKPVAFRTDADAAIKDAQEKKRPYFLKFETDWCVPCKQMHALVFTAKAVTGAADGVTCVVVDGDARKDLVKRYDVGGYPTGILFGPDGKEVARFSGYRGVKETAEFFGRLKR